MTAVGFEPTPLRTGALSQRLRPLGQTVADPTACIILCMALRKSGYFMHNIGVPRSKITSENDEVELIELRFVNRDIPGAFTHAHPPAACPAAYTACD